MVVSQTEHPVSKPGEKERQMPRINGGYSRSKEKKGEYPARDQEKINKSKKTRQRTKQIRHRAKMAQA